MDLFIIYRLPVSYNNLFAKLSAYNHYFPAIFIYILILMLIINYYDIDINNFFNSLLLECFLHILNATLLLGII